MCSVRGRTSLASLAASLALACSGDPSGPGIEPAWVFISAGWSHTCGVAPGGAAYCWGDNSYGQLGDGATTDRATPDSVTGGLTFQSIHASYYHTCGVTPSGTAYCWGANGPSGRLGNGDTTLTSENEPVPVSGTLVLTMVSAGHAHTCGVAQSAHCWGFNGDGGLGDGTTTERLTRVRVAR